MSRSQIAQVLDQLREERSLIANRLADLQLEIRELGDQLQRIDGAINALDVNAKLTRDFDMGQPPKEIDDHDIPRLRFEAPVGSVERLADFVTRGVGRERDGLQSAKMVAAVVDALDRPAVPREIIKLAFFEFFDRELLTTYWQDPDKAFNSAFARAVERDMILEVENYSGPKPLYMSGFRVVKGDRPRRVQPLGGGGDVV